MAQRSHGVARERHCYWVNIDIRASTTAIRRVTARHENRAFQTHLLVNVFIEMLRSAQ